MYKHPFSISNCRANSGRGCEMELLPAVIAIVQDDPDILHLADLRSGDMLFV